MGFVHSGSPQVLANPALSASARRVPREHVLEEAALDAARTWTARCIEDLERDGRRIEGGWPGTLHEARGRCAQLAACTLSRLSMPALTWDELDRITQITYVEARRLWMAS
jgi:hypothetical protein